jgi:transposase
MEFLLTPGPAHALVGAEALLPQVKANTVIADKGYDTDARVLAPLTAAGKTAVIPPTSPRKNQREYDRELDQLRHLIENFFLKLKQYQGIATRYDNTDQHFLAAIYAAATIILLN